MSKSKKHTAVTRLGWYISNKIKHHYHITTLHKSKYMFFVYYFFSSYILHWVVMWIHDLILLLRYHPNLVLVLFQFRYPLYTLSLKKVFFTHVQISHMHYIRKYNNYTNTYIHVLQLCNISIYKYMLTCEVT